MYPFASVYWLQSVIGDLRLVVCRFECRCLSPPQDSEEGKPKRRVKLDMHLEQLFVDGNDAYVWIYDPIPTHYWLLGILLVLAIVAVCLFPLWPAKVR